MLFCNGHISEIEYVIGDGWCFDTHEYQAHNAVTDAPCLRGRYVPEWSDIDAAIATSIDKMFSDRIY